MDYVNYIAHVEGRLWQGNKGSTEYIFGKLPKRTDILLRAGDFETVDSIRLQRKTVHFEDVEVL